MMPASKSLVTVSMFRMINITTAVSEYKHTGAALPRLLTDGAKEVRFERAAVG
jgi:hypothetical protein